MSSSGSGSASQNIVSDTCSLLVVFRGTSLMTRVLCRVVGLLKPQGVWHTSKMALVDLGDMRKPYKGAQDAFDIGDLVPSKCPIEQFTKWFDEAAASPEIIEPNAMAIATATKDGVPSVRMVLLKGYDKQGFQFFTNYNSRKGQELKDNPVASIVFNWYPIAKSIRIDGTVEKLSEEESTSYFHRRPKDSQIGASLSEQSTVIEGRHVLANDSEKLSKEYADSDVLPKPEHWGGFRVKPSMLEFWQGQTTRLHDRFRFRRPAEGETIDSKVTHQGADGWVFERLAP